MKPILFFILIPCVLMQNIHAQPSSIDTVTLNIHAKPGIDVYKRQALGSDSLLLQHFGYGYFLDSHLFLKVPF